MPTPKKPIKKGIEPKSKAKTAQKKFDMGNGKMGTLAQRDSMSMSHGYTPYGNQGKAKPPKTSLEAGANKSAAAKSNPAKTGENPRYKKDFNTNYQARSTKSPGLKPTGAAGKALELSSSKTKKK